MKKLEISKIKSKLKEWARSWISLDWEKTNIWKKSQNTVSAFFPWLPIIIFYTFKEESVLANSLQNIIVIVSVLFLFHLLKSRNFIKRFFLFCQVLLTLMISVLILRGLTTPSDLDIWLQFISSLLYLEITIIAIMITLYGINPIFLKLKLWLIFLSIIGLVLISLFIFVLFAEVDATNVFIITAIYEVLIKLTEPKTFLSTLYPDAELDSCVIKKDYKISFSIINNMVVISYLSILITARYYKQIILLLSKWSLYQEIVLKHINNFIQKLEIVLGKKD